MFGGEVDPLCMADAAAKFFKASGLKVFFLSVLWAAFSLDFNPV